MFCYKVGKMIWECVSWSCYYDDDGVDVLIFFCYLSLFGLMYFLYFCCFLKEEVVVVLLCCEGG